MAKSNPRPDVPSIMAAAHALLDALGQYNLSAIDMTARLDNKLPSLTIRVETAGILTKDKAAVTWAAGAPQLVRTFRSALLDSEVEVAWTDTGVKPSYRLAYIVASGVSSWRISSGVKVWKGERWYEPSYGSDLAGRLVLLGNSHDMHAETLLTTICAYPDEDGNTASAAYVEKDAGGQWVCPAGMAEDEFALAVEALPEGVV